MNKALKVIRYILLQEICIFIIYLYVIFVIYKLLICG